MTLSQPSRENHVQYVFQSNQGTIWNASWSLSVNLVYYQNPGLNAGDPFPLWTLHWKSDPNTTEYAHIDVIFQTCFLPHLLRNVTLILSKNVCKPWTQRRKARADKQHSMGKERFSERQTAVFNASAPHSIAAIAWASFWSKIQPFSIYCVRLRTNMRDIDYWEIIN